jgi:hypothetical protein
MTSSSLDPDERESQAILFLDELPLEFDPVLIGGYAVAAYAPPRYSVDVDLTLPAKRAGVALQWLRRSNFKAELTLSELHGKLKLTKYRMRRGSCSGDLYFGGLVSRPSGAVVPHSWIGKLPRLTTLELRSGTTRRPFPVARPEALWTLKLLAGRPQDLTDLFMMMHEPVDSSEVKNELRLLLGLGLDERRETLTQLLGDEREFRDALSRRELGSPKAAKLRKEWDRFRNRVEDMLTVPHEPSKGRSDGAPSAS